MKEFMFYIRNEKNAKKSLTEEKHLAFIKPDVLFIGQSPALNLIVVI